MKKSIRNYQFALFVAFCVTHAKAQVELNIGDRLPQELTSMQLNTLDGSTSIAELSNGKLVFIDFWATWCGPCIKGLSEMNALKKAFEGKIEVLAVTYESKEKVNAFLGKRKELQNLAFPMVSNDTLLSKFFPHRIVPHIVWIDGQGKIASITSKDAVTEETIREFLKNNQSNTLRVKQDMIEFDYALPLTDEHSESLGSSLLVRSIPGTASRGYSDIDSQGLPPFVSLLKEKRLIKRDVLFNSTVAGLYLKAAFSGRIAVTNRSRLTIEVKEKDAVNPSKEFLNANAANMDAWKQEHLFCYQLSFKDYLPLNQFYKHMLADLNRFLPYEGRIEKKNVPSYVFTFHGDKSKIIAHHNTDVRFLVNEGNNLKGFYSLTMQQVLDYLNFDNTGIPLVNETHLDGLLDLPVNFVVDKEKGQIDMDQLSASFKSLGFEIVLEQRWLDMLVIKDK